MNDCARGALGVSAGHNFFGLGARLHHVGLAVQSLAGMAGNASMIEDPIQDVRLSFVSINGLQFELLEPRSDRSPVAQSVKNNVKLVHVCFEVPDISKALECCRPYGFHCIKRPVPAVAFDGRDIAWVYSRIYGLVELLQEEKRAT